MLVKVFEATVLLALVLVFINVILKELKESKKIIRLFSSIVVSIYIITIVVALAFSFANTTTEADITVNEVVIEL